MRLGPPLSMGTRETGEALGGLKVFRVHNYFYLIIHYLLMEICKTSPRLRFLAKVLQYPKVFHGRHVNTQLRGKMIG